MRGPRLALIQKTEAAVKDRLTKEITYWDHRAAQFKEQEQAGRANAKLNSGRGAQAGRPAAGALTKAAGRPEARSADLTVATRGAGRPAGRADGLACRCDRPAITRAIGTARHPSERRPRPRDRHEIERGLGFEPIDREFEKLGYDIESRVPGTGKLRFIEVKGRVSGADTITVTKNEILYSLNKPEDFILAIVEFQSEAAHRVYYLRQPFQREPDFGVTSVNYDFSELLVRAGSPS